jgi:hypothetical protein
MGQKSNLLTVRAAKVQSNVLTDNSKLFVYGLVFLNFFEKLLRKKNVLLVNKELNFEANKGYLSCSVFFKSAKLSFYDKKKNSSALASSFFLQSLVTTYFSLFTNNVIHVSFTNLNKDINQKALRFYYTKTKKFINSLFARRFKLFIDFLKFVFLFEKKKIKIESFLFVLGHIFRILPKRKHTVFLIFLKVLFVCLIKNVAVAKNKNILGLKFMINGRLKGKPRSSSAVILVGSVPVQSLSKKIEYAKLHVNTLMGVFGFQFWVYRK